MLGGSQSLSALVATGLREATRSFAIAGPTPMNRNITQFPKKR
jgi:hypothetical protein